MSDALFKPWTVDIIDRGSQQVVRSVGVMNMREAEQVERGMNINLDRKKYYTCIGRNKEVTANGDG